MPSRDRQGGFALLEVLVSLVIAALMMAIALPNFVTALDRAYLWETTCRIVSDLRSQQVLARQQQAYQEMRFAPFASYYELYSDGIGYTRYVSFDPGVNYEDGYLHLPEPIVRFNPQGNVSESGKIGLEDPEGDKETIVICLQSGDLHFTRGLAR